MEIYLKRNVNVLYILNIIDKHLKNRKCKMKEFYLLVTTCITIF